MISKTPLRIRTTLSDTLTIHSPAGLIIITHFSLTPSIPARLTLTSIPPSVPPFPGGQKPRGAASVCRYLVALWAFLISHYSFLIPGRANHNY